VSQFRISLTTPGATIIAATPPAGWKVESSTATSVAFRDTAAAVQPKGAQSGFVLQLQPVGSNPVTAFQWCTSFGADALCCGTSTMTCPTQQIRRDSLFHSRRSDSCAYQAGFANKHTPAGTLNGFRLRVLTGGAGIATPAPASGWSIVTQTAISAVFTTATPVTSGGTVSGFQFTLVPPATNGPVRIERFTMSGGSDISGDTVTLQCTPAITQCDSVRRAQGAGDCAWRLSVTNAHLPASPLNGFRLSLMTPGSSIASAVPPAGWKLESLNATVAVFTDTAGSLSAGVTQDGFDVTLQPASGNATIVYQWCTIASGATLCCATASVTCQTAANRCDSLMITPTAARCTFDAGFANFHQPSGMVDRFTVRLATAGAVFSQATPPSGWTVTQADTTTVVFTSATGGIPSGALARGFLLSVLPPSDNSTVRMPWCTQYLGQDLCCDTVVVECQPETNPDSVVVRPDPARPCCSEFLLYNRHKPISPITLFRLRVLTPGVTIFEQQLVTPSGWGLTSTPLSAEWASATAGLSSGDQLSNCVACFDNNSIANGDFDVAWETWNAGRAISDDTVRLACTRTLGITPMLAPTPSCCDLLPNYPNPVQGRTTLAFDIHQSADMVLDVLDVRGAVVETLASGFHARGRYLVEWNASGLPDGVYLYRLRAAGICVTRVLLLMK
jgi:hypothetical protein